MLEIWVVFLPEEVGAHISHMNARVERSCLSGSGYLPPSYEFFGCVFLKHSLKQMPHLPARALTISFMSSSYSIQGEASY